MHQGLMIQLTLMLLIASSAQVALAHDGSDHGNELEMWISGIGIIVIISLTIYKLWWQQRGLAPVDKDHDFFSDQA